MFTLTLARASIATTDPCADPDLRDAYNCTNTAGCGWCMTTFSCMPGNASGPYPPAKPDACSSIQKSGQTWTVGWAGTPAALNNTECPQQHRYCRADLKSSAPPPWDPICSNGGQRRLVPCSKGTDGKCSYSSNLAPWLGLHRCDCPPARSGITCGGCVTDDGCPAGDMCVSPFAGDAVEKDADMHMVRSASAPPVSLAPLSRRVRLCRCAT